MQQVTDESVIATLTTLTPTDVKLSSVVLSEQNKGKVEWFLKERYNKQKLRAVGLEPANRLFFSGDSGCGKTFLARALCNELGCRMLCVDIAEAIATNDAPKNIKIVFEYAKKLSNCLIFLDECDSIAIKRDTKKAGSFNTLATTSVFQQLDLMNTDTIVIAATNFLSDIDIAFDRRFRDRLLFKKPSGTLDELIDRFLHKDKGFVLSEDCGPTTHALLNAKVSLSYNEIQECVEAVLKRCVIENTRNVSQNEIYKWLAERSMVTISVDEQEEL